MKRYLVLTLRKPAFDPAMIEPHYAHLDRLRAQGVLELAGPFGDRSGCAYLLLAGSLDDGDRGRARRPAARERIVGGHRARVGREVSAPDRQ